MHYLIMYFEYLKYKILPLKALLLYNKIRILHLIKILPIYACYPFSSSLNTAQLKRCDGKLYIVLLLTEAWIKIIFLLDASVEKKTKVLQQVQDYISQNPPFSCRNEGVSL